MTNKALLERLKKISTIKESAILEDSMFFNEKDLIPTDVPMLNVAHGGAFDAGFAPGLTIWAGPSKHFKTSLTLVDVKAFLDKYDDGICLFYDSEFGTPQAYFSSFGIDTARVFHTPVTNIEELKFDLMQQIDAIKRGDKVIIVIDSIGNLASKKEVEDALDGKSVADMTRAKQLKSLFRMVTPHLTMKDLPMIVVNHTYKTQEMYSKDVVSGGTGVYYSADNIFIIGRQQDKDGDELIGYNFIINVEKSRFVREKSKIPITVSFDHGISKWSGMLDLAIELGLVTKPKIGWYTRPCIENDKMWRAKETSSKDFWMPVLKETDFSEQVKKKYKLAQGEMINTEAYAEDED
jgi:RecA/RadA recombinase